MARNSFYFLRIANAKQNGIGDMTSSEYNAKTGDLWNAISGDVKGYLKLENKTQHHIAKSSAITKQDAAIRSPEKEEDEISAK